MDEIFGAWEHEIISNKLTEWKKDYSWDLRYVRAKYYIISIKLTERKAIHQIWDMQEPNMK